MLVDKYYKSQGNQIQLVEVDSEKLDRLVNLLGELVINRTSIEQVTNELKVYRLNEGIEQGNRIITELQDLVMKIRMVPIDILFSKMFDVIKHYNEQSLQRLDIIVKGEKTEIDRTIVKALEEPLYNIVEYVYKNSVQSSNPNNEICLTAFTEGRNVIIKIITNTKLEYSEHEGKKIADIGGNMSINGSEAVITIPLNISIIKALLVKLGKQNYALPLDIIDTIVNSDSFKIASSNGREVLIYRNNMIPLIRISRKLNITQEDCDSGFAIIVNIQGSTFSLLVDSLNGQRDIVVKPLPNLFKKQKEFSGATILGDGMITLIIDAAGLI